MKTTRRAVMGLAGWILASALAAAYHQLGFQTLANQAAVAISNAHLFSEIAESRDQLQAILDSADDGLLIFDPSSRIVMVNPCLETMWNMPHGWLNDRRLIELLDEVPGRFELLDAYMWLVAKGRLAEERDQVAKLVDESKAPNVDVQILFAFDSAEILPEALPSLNELGKANGIGRIDLVENRFVGMKSRGVYETPGGTILYEAHKALEQICMERDTLHYKQQVALRYAELVYNGQWFTPLRYAMDAFIDSTQERVTGKVRLKLYKGNVIPIGRQSRYSLYREDFATFGQDSVYDQGDAQGFITLFGLPMKVAAMRDILNGAPSQIEKPDYSKFKRD